MSPSPTLRSGCRRFLTVSIPPVPLFESVYVVSEVYAVLVEYSQDRTSSRLIICTWVPIRLHQEVMAMCTKVPSMAREFASNVCGSISGMVQKRPPRCVIDTIPFPLHHRQQNPQTFCREAVMWKHLKHQNIVPLKGVTIDPFQLVSDWVSGGDLPDYIRTNPDADRPRLVSTPAMVFTPRSLPLQAV